MQPKQLGILAKTLIIVCTLVCILTLSFLAVSFSLVMTKFQQLETDEAQVNLERVVNELNNSRKKLESLVGDWAPWDDTYAFVRELNHDYIEKNLSAESFRTLGINFMLFFDNSNQLVFSQFFNLDQTTAMSPDLSAIFALKAMPNFFQFATHQTRKSGLIRSSTTAVLIAGAPIVTSTYDGPSRGTLVFGRYLDQSKLHQISSQTRVNVDALAYDQKLERLFSSKNTHLFSIDAALLPVAYHALNDQVLNAYAALNDLRGKPIVVFAITQERKLLHQGLAMWQKHALSLVALGMLFILMMVLLLHRIILRPLTRLSGEVDQIAQVGCHDLRVTVSNRDEIGALSIAINTMLSSLQTLQQLQGKNEQHLKDIIDSINCGIMLVDVQDRRIISINRAGATMAGRLPEEITGKICHQFICPRELNCCPVLDEGESVDLSERTINHADGHAVPVLKSVSRIEREDRSLLVESFIDITELKKIQAEVAASEAKYRQFFEEDLTGNFVSTTDGTLIDCNPAFAEILGYATPNDIIGGRMDSHYTAPENRYALLERIQEKGKLERYDGVLRHRNGQTVYIISNLIGEFDDQGHLQRIRGYIFDDTKRVLLEKEIRQAQKLEAIGTMAGGIAHDFNNILAGIMGYTEIVLRDLDEQQAAKSCRNLRNILTAGERARGLIEKMLTFSRQSEGDRKPVSLARTLEDVLELIRVSLPSTIAIEPQIANHPTVSADPIQIHQVFMNLCTNAGHAMKERGGTLTITLDHQHLDADFTGRFPELTTGDYARIQIEDTGKGIPPRLIERIYDPFFTTKGKGEGTGLGLSMVHGIVKAMHGLVTVESEEGRGTAFTIYLPTIEAEETVISDAHLSIPTGHEHVVYVDDEGFLVDIGTEILRGLGYAVTGFTDSREALDYLLSHSQGVDLVISDMTMPQVTGIELAQQLQKLEAPPPVIICTGHNEGLSQDDVAFIGVRQMLLKPVTVNKLAQVVRSVLDNKDQS
ncbi:MAG: CHASE4 domain-containing protein [Desulfobulbus sp.]|nr:CHASE4 domain-containing protein [Desulfobulbus sp.]